MVLAARASRTVSTYMRIVDSNQTAGPAQTNWTRPGDNAASAAPGTPVSQPNDTVELSGITGQVSETLASDASSRADKVNQIAAAVQSGSYQIDSQAISQSLIQHALGGSGMDGDGDGS